MVITIEGIDPSRNGELGRWIQMAARKAGCARYVQVVSIATYDSAFAEVTFYLDVQTRLMGELRRARNRYLANVQRDPCRYVVIDAALPLKDQHETAWRALVMKLAQKGIQICHKSVKPLLASEASEAPMSGTWLKPSSTA